MSLVRLIALVLLAASQAVASQSQAVLVQGMVTNGNPGDPVPSVQVRLSTTRPGELRPVEYTAFTSTDGKFQLSVPPGEYTILAQRPGFFGPAVNGVPSVNDTRKLTVAAGRSLENQKLSLMPGAVITGRVVDHAGAVPARVTIVAMQVRYDNGKPSVVRVRMADTNDLGEYRIYWIPPGDYFVMYDPGITSVATATIVGPDSAILTRTYYPGSTKLDSARVVSVPPGSELKNIDFALNSTPSFKVSGRVVNPYAPTGGPPPDISSLPNFTLVSSDFTVQEIIMSSFANSVPLTERQSGAFELKGIPPGRYELFASVRTPAFALTHSGSVAIDVNGQDVNNLVISVHPPADVKGRVVVNGNVRLPDKAKVRLRYTGSFRISPALETEADANGEFTFRSLADGLYRISLAPPANAFVSDVHQGERSIYGDNLVRVGGDAPLSVRISLSPDPGSVSGTVNHPQSKKGADTTVVLVPEAARSNFFLYQAAQADDTGQFKLNSIEPGRYKLFAWEGVPSNAWLNATFLSRYEDQGTALTVAPGANTGLRVPVIWLK